MTARSAGSAALMATNPVMIIEMPRMSAIDGRLIALLGETGSKSRNAAATIIPLARQAAP
jgi:hypothetical protein